ncbi:MAG TPA: 16S rRNA (cytosine(1402)-N(4))-methyltransferase, partial [Vicinamibacterales bacterium]|nr:16S rRNA (cytosine(1402)-N(4))-methyltransferase [Vicinamibacterales bacterium]
MVDHAPVMVDEVLAHLAPSRGGTFVDCTVGLGGHARALLQAGASRLLGIDRDPEALERARAALAAFGDRVELVHGDYRQLAALLDARGLTEVAGVLADLGVSSL